MKRIAFIVNEPLIGVHQAKLVETLKKVEGSQITVFLAQKDDYSDLRRTGWLYRAVFAAETFILGLFFKKLRSLSERRAIGAVPHTGPGDETFDLIVNMTAGELKRERFPESNDGHVGIQFGDLSRGLAGPPGFWESQARSGATGIFLKRADKCIFSARYKSKRTQSLNAENVIREGFFDLQTVFLRYQRTGVWPLPKPCKVPVWKSPSFWDVLVYRFKTAVDEVRVFLIEYVQARMQRFSVSVVKGYWRDADLDEAHLIPNRPARYFADPFVITRDDRTICFVEDFSFRLNRGRISAFDLGGDEPEYLGPVIEEPCHMSFPYVFEFGDDLFMIPETFEAEEISIYRCTEFPMEWERYGSLMDDVEASDTMVFERNGRWWMLTNLRPEGCMDFYSRLYAFYSDSPLSGNWTPHALNPVLIDSDGGRNGGLLSGRDGDLYRVGQHQGMTTYGEAYSIFRIDALSPTAYRESKIQTVAPLPGSDLIGGHHLHGNASFTVFDTLKWERP